MATKFIMHLIHFISSILICGIALVFCGKNKAVAVWNSAVKMNGVITDGGEDEEILDG